MDQKEPLYMKGFYRGRAEGIITGQQEVFDILNELFPNSEEVKRLKAYIEQRTMLVIKANKENSSE